MLKGRFRVLTIASGSSALDTIAPRLSVAGASAVTEKVADMDEGIMALEVDDYDCILFDVGNSPTPATDLQQKLSDLDLATPIIVVADQLASADMVDLLRAGVADCINSDELRIDKVIRAIWNATRTARTERALNLAEQQRSFNALHDTLTGLPNRTLFFDRLEQAMSISERQREPMALLTLDINGFSDVNGEMGHHIGDTLLRQLAERLDGALRKSDTLARIGDDQFAIVMPTGATKEGAEQTAEKLIRSLDMPFDIGEHSFTIGIRIGVAFYPDHATRVSHLVIRAENAMREGRRTDQRFAINFAGGASDENSRRPLIEDLRLALKDGDRQLFVSFQPKIDLKKSQIAGVEALVRWRHPTRGMIFPDQFIPMAEDGGLIDRLTAHVLHHSLAQQAAWKAEGFDISVSINVSAKTLQNPKLAHDIEMAIAKWTARPDRVIIEITESAIILDVAKATATLEALDRLGVRISIDDFGTGYTCLSYIRRLPVQEIKVDKSFVMGMSKSPDDWVIVSSLIELGHNLGMTVVAEGIEDAPTLIALTEIGCDSGQGYHMSRPVPAEDLTEWFLTSEWGIKPLKRDDDTPGESETVSGSNIHHLRAG